MNSHSNFMEFNRRIMEFAELIMDVDRKLKDF